MGDTCVKEELSSVEHLNKQRSIQNPVKHLKWSDLQKKFVEHSILDVWQSSEYASTKYFRF